MNMAKHSGRQTGFACSNCQTQVFEFDAHYENPVTEEVETDIDNHCLCTRGLYKTNLSRDALAKNYWRRMK